MNGRLVAGLMICASIGLTAESAPAVYKTWKELTGVLVERGKATPAPEMVAANVNSNGSKYQINVVRRMTPQGAIAHAVGSEIHSIIEGSGTLVTGGTIVRAAGAARGAGTIDGGVSRHVSKGDVILVPPGTPHWYQSIDGQQITYLETRFDVGAPSNGPAVYLSDADWHRTLAARGQATPAPLMFSASLGRGDKFGANIVRRTKAQGGGAHELGTEVHHVLEGSGTLVTGGTVVRKEGPNGPATIEGGISRHVEAGDVVLVPANLPHWYKDVNGSITYLEMRFEIGTK